MLAPYLSVECACVGMGLHAYIQNANRSLNSIWVACSLIKCFSNLNETEILMFEIVSDVNDILWRVLSIEHSFFLCTVSISYLKFVSIDLTVLYFVECTWRGGKISYVNNHCFILILLFGYLIPLLHIWTLDIVSGSSVLYTTQLASLWAMPYSTIFLNEMLKFVFVWVYVLRRALSNKKENSITIRNYYFFFFSFGRLFFSFCKIVSHWISDVKRIYNTCVNRFSVLQGAKPEVEKVNTNDRINLNVIECERLMNIISLPIHWTASKRHESHRLARHKTKKLNTHSHAPKRTL